MSAAAADVEAGAGAVPLATEAKPKSKAVSQWSKAQATRNLRLANLCNGVCLITLGIIVFLVGITNISFASVTVSAYVVFFGLMMSCLECNLSYLAPRFRKNFGFMFSFYGRALFIIFCGTMAYAMSTWLSYIVGSITILNGLFNGYVICVNPEMKGTGAADPYGAYTGGEQEMLAYLRSNPKLAHQAGAAAIQIAAANPQAAAQVMAAGAGGGAAGGAAPERNPWG